MSFFDIAEKINNLTFTEKGDVAYNSSLSRCVDYFALVGGKRDKIDQAFSLFNKAYFEDNVTALKLLLYTRDRVNGIGERNLFRVFYHALANYKPEEALLLLPYVPKYGRYDDLFALIDTPIEGEMITYISNQLKKDIEDKKNNKPISLLAKWMPSINTSNKVTRLYARYLADKLGMDKKTYRKTLSFLRDGMIIEKNLCNKDYSFDYENVPSIAMSNYRKAFKRNDNERFSKYLEDVNNENVTMNVDRIDVVNFIRRVKRVMFSHDEDPTYYETTWKEIIKDKGINKKTLVVRDGSGSMHSYFADQPIDVADAMTLLTAARLEGFFHNRFITFSSDPKIIKLDSESVIENAKRLQHFGDISTTDIQKVYDLILGVYKHKAFTTDDQLDQILIISDMEFDALKVTRKGYDVIDELDVKSTFEYFKNEFGKLNYKMPEIIFWNVDARNETVPVTMDENGVKLISGRDKNIVDLVVSVESMNPLTFMNNVLERYAFIDELMKK